MEALYYILMVVFWVISLLVVGRIGYGIGLDKGVKIGAEYVIKDVKHCFLEDNDM